MTTQLLTFTVAGSAYGVPLSRVSEVVSCRTIARVPNADDCIRGVMNLRGNVVPVIDLSRRLGGGNTALAETTCAILIAAVIEGIAMTVATLVEEICAVLDVDSGAVAPAPEFGTPLDPSLVHGVTSAGDQLVYVLDLDAVLAGIA